MPRKTLAEQLEDLAFTPLRLACKFSAEGIVRDLQEKGPSWTGKFANSYQIESPSKRITGSKSAGAPQRIKAPRLTAKEIKFKPTIKYKITNVAPYRNYALDLEEGKFYPKVPKSSSKPPVVQGGSRPSTLHKRGQVSSGGGTATSTAELDWYTTYTQGARMDKTVQIAVDKQFKGVKL